MTAPPGGPEGFEARLAEIRHRIDAVAADPSSVRIVAVTKGFGVEAARLALAAGLVDLGENYADELVAKAGQLTEADTDAAGRAAWHYLGAMQRNKVARLAPLVSCWQGLSRLAEGQAIARRAPGASVLVQIDVAGLPGRGGCAPERVPELVAELRDLALSVDGLMAVGPPGTPEAARPGFALLSSLADSLDLPGALHGHDRRPGGGGVRGVDHGAGGSGPVR